MRHEAGGRVDAVYDVAYPAVRYPGCKCEELVDFVHLAENNGGNERRRSKRDADDLDVILRRSQI